MDSNSGLRAMSPSYRRQTWIPGQRSAIRDPYRFARTRNPLLVGHMRMTLVPCKLREMAGVPLPAAPTRSNLRFSSYLAERHNAA